METQHQNVTILHGNTVDYEQLISASENEFDLSQACCRLTATNNYKYYAVMRLPTDDEDTLASICMVTNWPINLIEEYDRLELLKDSPLFGHMKTSTEPLIFELPSLNCNRIDGKGEAAAELFEKFGAKVGLCFSTRMPDGTVGAVIFVGDRSHPSNAQILELHYFSNLLFSKADMFKSRSLDERKQMTSRELNCLQLTSEGMSIEEVSAVSGMSAHTVSLIMKSAARKLSASNRTHAVSKALRIGLIS